ncbi:AAA family ATPase [Mesorhizobium sp.]|uniref:AAA family ATPase n=1 Tax=Mesorhizobium sp. TaxID=1871066 RepID=UPI001206F4AE|nr:AAA family ATPase [Mesorhizobium sp.]TIL49094.1 MAG: AAA family ATPase [Mesorhizobium sp.]
MVRDANDILRKDGEATLRERIDGTRQANGRGQETDLGDTETAPPPPAKAPRFRVIPFADIRPDDRPSYLVKGLIPRRGLVVVWGPPKCGKSYWMFDLAMHVALGWSYRGHRVLAGPVVYVALEGQEGFKARVEAFRRRHLAGNAGPVPFWLMVTPLNLAKDQEQLTRELRAQLAGTTPALVVLDTLNKSLVGSESKDEDMAAYVRAADAIVDAFGCAVGIVHHCGINDSRPRGHTSLTGAADAQLSVKRDVASNIVVTVEYMKDGPAEATLLSRLEVVELGRDVDGDPITACIVEPLDAEAEQAAKRKPAAKLSKGNQTALRALGEAILAVGTEAPVSNTIPATVKVVTRTQWRDYALRRGLAGEAKERGRRAAFQRAVEDLGISGDIGVSEPFVWLAK